VDIPVFQDIRFELAEYDLFQLPLWVDTAIEKVKELASLDARIGILEKQSELLGEELRVTSQRVNLFEKVKIPETRENIRMIQIYLGDEQTAAVVRGKIAKKKLVRVNQ
jgi:V/A-type H+-transporting ATPase subunit D